MSTIESLLSQLKEAARTADLSVRFQLSEQLLALSRSVATPRQILQYHGYLYSEHVTAKIAVDLDLFTILAENNGPLNTEDVSKKCGGDLTLIDRILKHLASTYTITQVGESSFAANETTHLLASPAGKGNIMFGFNILNKAFQELPDFLKENGYKSPENPLETAFNRAFNTKEQFFPYIQQIPDIMRDFYPSLTAFKSPVPWTSVFPLAEKLREADKNVPLFVDIGGGHGYQCDAFRKAIAEYDFSGRVINQDLPGTLASAPKHDNVEMMAQNFNEKQQVQGANIYYIRQCLHDFPDKEAKQVLQNIRDAMSPKSLLLIDEMVIPNIGASPFSMQLDFTMMAFLSSAERTLSHWRKLLEEVGLQLIQVYKYDTELEYSILEAVKVDV
ncbi:35c97764-98e9-4b0b-85eb-c879caea947e [Sclerotinia trifoliorum]|uniref:35c97764-98e9-4b0b-85eb-c879caea947e n=1 Tax=Sclerotinia trifoliorum TaxID=28548 RepID=A0A8H2W180_9HELO|nr:35c97764-98e9-4b0b-85eb-c879caea947e [Sclerotinia trifoliorum]